MNRLRFFPFRRLPQSEQRQQPAQGSPDTPTVDMPPISPSYADVCVVRAMLKALKLPTELVLDILDRACYWPTCEFPMPRGVTARAGRGEDAMICIDAGVLRQDLLKRIGGEKDKAKIREIEFEIRSRDQGWTSEQTQGTFKTSSWLEVSILRPNDNSETNSPLNGSVRARPFIHPSNICLDLQACGWTFVERPDAPQGSNDRFTWYLQGNRVTASLSTYIVVWGMTGGESQENDGAGSGENFVEELQEGDRVLVWARAMVCSLLFLTLAITQGLFSNSARVSLCLFLI